VRAVLQRVKGCKVEVEEQKVGQIDEGLLVFLGIGEDDTLEDIEYLADKIINLRIFADKNGDMNLSVQDIEQDIMVVPQFTLYGDCRQGRRPSFGSAASPERAEQLYDKFVAEIKKSKLKIETGKFQAKMEVELINDGPVTLILDSNRDF